MRLLRTAIMAISDAAKRPLPRMRVRITIAANQRSSMVILQDSYFSPLPRAVKTAAVLLRFYQEIRREMAGKGLALSIAGQAKSYRPAGKRQGPSFTRYSLS